MFRHAAYFLERLYGSGRVYTLPPAHAIAIFHLSTAAHLAIFLESCTGVSPVDHRPAYTLKTWLEENVLTDSLPYPPEKDSISTQLALLFWSPSVSPPPGRAASIRRAFSVSRAPHKLIIHGNGTMWNGSFTSRVLRRVLRVPMAKIGAIRDEEERRILNSRLDFSLSDDPGTRPILSIPTRIVQDRRTGAILKPDLIARDDSLNEQYETAYHFRAFLDERRDWQSATHEYQNRRWRNIQRLAAQTTRFPSGGKALDIGCGTGALAARLAEEGFEATGVDVSPEAVEHARKTFPNVRFEVKPVECIDKNQGVYTFITLSHTLEHVRGDVATLRTVAGLLGEEGVVYIEVPLASEAALARRPFWYRQMDHCREYTKAGLCDAVEKAGLRILALADSMDEEGGEPFQFLLAKRRLLSVHDQLDPRV